MPRQAHHALYEVLSRRLPGCAGAEEADDALDQVLFRREAASLDALEADDVPALGFGEAVDELVDEHPVPDPERGDHALRGDVEGLHDERPDEAEDQPERDDQYDQELEDAAVPLLGGARAAVPARLPGGLELLVLVVGLLGHRGLRITHRSRYRSKKFASNRIRPRSCPRRRSRPGPPRGP